MGYLLGVGLDRRWKRVLGPGGASLALVVGTQVPDLVDKPLAWSLGVLPTGRSLAHSLLVGPVLVGLAVLLAWRYRRHTVWPAFAVGYLAHLAGDALYPALRGEFASLGFLLWPVVPPIEYETPQTFAAHFAQLAASPPVLFETGLFALAVLVALRRFRSRAAFV